MNIFQIIGISVTGVFFIISIVYAMQKKGIILFNWIWPCVWLAAAYFITQPDVTVTIAKMLGIGRGTDLVFYCAIIIMFIGFFILYLKIKKVESDITAVVRHIALEKKKEKE